MMTRNSHVSGAILGVLIGLLLMYWQITRTQSTDFDNRSRSSRGVHVLAPTSFPVSSRDAHTSTSLTLQQSAAAKLVTLLWAEGDYERSRAVVGHIPNSWSYDAVIDEALELGTKNQHLLDLSGSAEIEDALSTSPEAIAKTFLFAEELASQLHDPGRRCHWLTTIAEKLTLAPAESRPTSPQLTTVLEKASAAAQQVFNDVNEPAGWWRSLTRLFANGWGLLLPLITGGIGFVAAKLFGAACDQLGKSLITVAIAPSTGAAKTNAERQAASSSSNARNGEGGPSASRPTTEVTAT